MKVKLSLSNEYKYYAIGSNVKKELDRDHAITSLISSFFQLREELGREVSLRGSLEDSHAMLLQRTCEMESILESERREVS